MKVVKKSGSLSLKDLSTQQQGMHTCELSNEAETVVGSIVLNIGEDRGETESTKNVYSLKLQLDSPVSFRRKKNTSQVFPSVLQY